MQEDGAKGKDVLREEARNMRLFAKKFGHGVRQQRVRGKTKERAGTQPLALSRIRRIISPRTDNLPDMIKKLQALDEVNLKHYPLKFAQYCFQRGMWLL